ncbi:MAM and LDL-receptor class A domain-containing protein 1-like [Pecten maximus]|uniref:MAM and LDL-receptor class A domain-containing protein 1-like n=1 Tax=Pecten maximus TaxID=6579 RepID=UPI001458582E|nr:MAM and LDL-receptor class A domain-containing protein 1-like [Pecten maximus]
MGCTCCSAMIVRLESEGTPDIDMEWFGGLTVPVTIIITQFIVVATQTSVFDISCNFEQDLCNWASANITRSEYPNALARTGKSGPKQAKDGAFYVYLDTTRISSGVDFKGSLQRDDLVVPNGSDNVCLRFWYHMFGETMGSLEVLIDDSIVWTKTGNQSDAWHCAVVDIATLQSTISFVASMGNDTYSIIAIDSIDVLNTECKQQDCENLQFSTTTKTTTLHSSTLSSTSPTQPVGITTTAATQISLEEYIPYITGIPAAILLVGAIVLIVCLRRHKTKPKEPFMVVPSHQEQINSYDQFPQDQYDTIGVKDEVYDYINDSEILPLESLPTGDIGVTNTANTGQENNDYEDPIPQNGEIVGNQGGNGDDDYLNPTSRQSAVISDDDYITPTNDPVQPQRTSSGIDSEEPVRANLHRPSITSAGGEVDSHDYLVMTGTKGKKGSANLAFSHKE